MIDVQFFQTRMGKQFYEVTMPELVRQLTRLNNLLALQVELLEKRSEPRSDNDRPRED